MLVSGLSMSAQSAYGTRNRQYRPKPGTVIGNSHGSRGGSGYNRPGMGSGSTRFSAIVEGGPAFLLSSEDYRTLSGDISLSAGAYTDMGLFIGPMVKYTGAGSYKVGDTVWKASNTILGADLRYFFPAFVMMPFIGGQAGADFRHVGGSDNDTHFFGAVKVGVQCPLGPFCSGIVSIGVETIAGKDGGRGITTLPITVGLQF